MILIKRYSGEGILKRVGDSLFSRGLKNSPSLAAAHPEIAAQWHPSKNSPLLPIHVTGGSGAKVWWQCPSNPTHVWEATIHNRVQGRGCPYCSGRLAAPDTSLEALNPTLASEWDLERNGSIRPSSVRPMSGKKVWWKCSAGHSWEAVIAKRSSGQGCPVCANLKVHTDNCLATLYPDLAAEWHPHRNADLTPQTVVAGSEKRVWWQCKKNPTHEWQTTVAQRTAQKTGCPFCNAGPGTSTTELRVYAELSALFSRVEFRAKFAGVECDVYVPEARFAVEIDGGYWHKGKSEKDLRKNRRVEAVGIKLFRFRESNIPLLTDCDVHFQSSKATFSELKRLVQKIVANAALTERQQLVLYDYLQREDFANDELFANLLDRLPKPFPGTSLAEINPELASEWHPTKNGNLAPDAVNIGSNHKAWWQCKVNPLHQWQASIASRTRGNGCPFCAGKATDDTNSLATHRPDIAVEWHPTKNNDLSASDVTAKSNKKVWWQCKSNPEHQWEEIVANRTRPGRGCPYCSGKRPSKSYNLAVTFPDLAKEWHPTKNSPLKPEGVTPKSDKKVWWQCAVDPSHEWITQVKGRTKGAGCPFCSGRLPSKSNNFAVAFPDLAKEWHPTKNESLRPEDVTPKTDRKVWWQCPVDPSHEWFTRILNRAKGSGCPLCNKKGRKGKK